MNIAPGVCEYCGKEDGSHSRVCVVASQNAACKGGSLNSFRVLS